MSTIIALLATDFRLQSLFPWNGLELAGRSQAVSEGTGRARLCAYVKHSILNSAIEQELRDWRVEGRANATSSA